eukprot:TRINITY_DN2311_c0_g1_i1.p1 TRINITY_DN2311_c0_g1~~TRINITY_DN2311_c0_g1_i1.p1  ORF type:complete len:534 (+),score=143.38 TRINITY_DN2311_c0_g1_i1:53-1603(+)
MAALAVSAPLLAAAALVPVRVGLLPHAKGTLPWLHADLRNLGSAAVAVAVQAQNCCGPSAEPGGCVPLGVGGAEPGEVGAGDIRRFLFQMRVPVPDGGECEVVVRSGSSVVLSITAKLNPLEWEQQELPAVDPVFQVHCPPGQIVHPISGLCWSGCEFDDVPSPGCGQQKGDVCCMQPTDQSCFLQYGHIRPRAGAASNGRVMCLPPAEWVPDLTPAPPDPGPLTVLDFIPRVNVPSLLLPPDCGVGVWDPQPGRCKGCPGGPGCTLPGCACPPPPPSCGHGDRLKSGLCKCWDGWRSTPDAFERMSFCDAQARDVPQRGDGGGSGGVSAFESFFVGSPLLTLITLTAAGLWAAAVVGLCCSRTLRDSAVFWTRRGLAGCGLLSPRGVARLEKEERKKRRVEETAALGTASPPDGEDRAGEEEEAEEEEEDSSGLGWSSCASSPHALAPARSMYEEAVREATESRGSRFRTFTTVSALSADSPPARSGSHPLALFPSASPLLHTRSSTFFLSASRH